MSETIALDTEARNRLNAILDGCFWNSCFIDSHTRVGVAVVELIGVQFECQLIGDAFPLILACYPVTRAAASYKVDGRVRALDIEDLDSALQEFSSREIDDWDLVDPPASKQFLWRDEVSFDVNIGSGAGSHLLEMWQDEGPFQSLNLAMWFERLLLFKADLEVLTLEELERARERTRQTSQKGWLRTGVVPPVTAEEILRKFDSA